MKNEALKIETAQRMGAWFANLAAYNGGSMIGGWLYALDYDSFDSFSEAIQRVTRGAMRWLFMTMIIVQIWANIQIMKNYII